MKDIESTSHHAAGPTITAALVSVGGSPAPVLHVLRQFQPAYVWYFCSEGSRANADDIQTKLEWHPQARFIEVKRFEELGPCYRELRRRIPDILKETRVNPAEVLVDYTGGTKTMSAALVLAAMELFGQFSYVGGVQRERGGLGITMDGKERVLYQGNPWSDLAVREVERARDLWAGCQFDAAARLLRDVAPRVPHPPRFEVMALFADGLAARFRLDFAKACSSLKIAHGRMRQIFEATAEGGPMPLVQRALARCEQCAKEQPGQEFLIELLDNTLHTAALGRYEDAAARLYRAMEMQGQLWLREASGACFVNGKCPANRVAELPEHIRNLNFCKRDDEGDIKLSLEQCFQALHAYGDSRGTAVVADINRTKDGRTDSRLRAATEKRNTSILAHGVRPIGKEGFEQMKTLATEMLALPLDKPAEPLPVLDPAWLQTAT